MKKLIILLFIISHQLLAQTDQFLVRVEGLGCPFCAYGLEKKFRKVKGIKQIKIDISNGKMTYEVPATNLMKLTEADALVTKAGYVAKGISVLRSNGKTEKIGEPDLVVKPTKMGKQSAVFKVSGNCEMCKARIEKAAKSVKGVQSAVWDVDTKLMTVSFDNSKLKLIDIQNAIAKSGHDTELQKADDSTVQKLPACCQYR
ncbi:MAG TPA: cation transporter [Saprospiraceae bacterium]|nr:cation transporter [Saprospiraceae bacterium]